MLKPLEYAAELDTALQYAAAESRSPPFLEPLVKRAVRERHPLSGVLKQLLASGEPAFGEAIHGGFRNPHAELATAIGSKTATPTPLTVHVHHLEGGSEPQSRVAVYFHHADTRKSVMTAHVPRAHAELLVQKLGGKQTNLAATPEDD